MSRRRQCFAGQGCSAGTSGTSPTILRRSYGREPADKIDLVAPLLADVFAWRARKIPTSRSSAASDRRWDDISKVNAVQKVQLEQSDLISFHNYAPADDFERARNPDEARPPPALHRIHGAAGGQHLRSHHAGREGA